MIKEKDNYKKKKNRSCILKKIKPILHLKASVELYTIGHLLHFTLELRCTLAPRKLYSAQFFPARNEVNRI